MLGKSPRGAFSCGGNGGLYVGCAAEEEPAGACAVAAQASANETQNVTLQKYIREAK
jgi:hypothetical protein